MAKNHHWGEAIMCGYQGFFRGLSVVLLSVFLCALPRPVRADLPLRGVNLGMAMGGESTIPGKHGTNYLWPTPQEVDMYADWGVNVLRIPFLWERMQPALMGPFSEEELARLDLVVKAAAARKVTILIDVHNFGQYQKTKIGEEPVSAAAFVDFWARMARHYKNQPYVAYGLMNEPHKHTPDAWASLAQAGIDAIRSAGAQQLILVPGTYWSGAHSWNARHGSLSSNADALAQIKDPANNYVFELHQYFDADSSGTHPQCVSGDIGVQRLKAVTAWLEKNGHQGFLAEFGASSDPVCLDALRQTLDYMNDHSSAWRGWTYWAAAKWFGTYMFNVYPPDAEKFPQARILQQAFVAEPSVH